jgi:sigma-E factor negative regulatory protein RseC
MSQLIEHNGIINQIEGNQIRISIIQESACSACHAKEACSASEKEEKIIDIESSDSSFQIGDRVLLLGTQSIGLLAVLLAFVIPFLLILITLFILRSIVSNESVSGLLAISVLIPYYTILSFFNKRLKSKFQFTIKKEVQN